MRLHPAISIILGVIIPISILGYLFGIPKLPLDATSENMEIIISSAIIFGGFIATYLTAGKRIVYSFGVGIIISSIVLILSLGSYKGYNYLIFMFVFYSLIAGIGGFFGKNIVEIERKLTRAKYKISNTISETQKNILGAIFLVGMFSFFIIGLSFTSGPCIITIQSSGFSPNSTILDMPGYITWINNDTKIHHVVSDNGLFDSGNLTPGQSYSYYTNIAGVYHYHDAVNPSMKGAVGLPMPVGEG